MSAPAFPTRHLMAAFTDGGVLLDLGTGAYFRLNPSALEICAELARGRSRGETETALVDRHGISPVQASAAVSAVLAELATPGTVAPGSGAAAASPASPAPPSSPATAGAAGAGPLAYRATTSGWAYWDARRPVIEASADGRTVRLCVPAAELPMPVEACVRALAPKVLALLGVPILHVGCCAIAGQLVAFGGRSGAGKTTTTRVLVAAGAELVAEDTLALADAPTPAELGGISVFTESERALRAWAAGAARVLESSPRGTGVDTSPLASIARGARAPLARIMFLDPARRGGTTTITGAALTPADALAAFLDAGFLASDDPAGWHRYFAQAETLARHLAAFSARVPDGVEALRAAARDFVDGTRAGTV